MKTIKVTYDNCRLLIGKEVIEKRDVLELLKTNKTKEEIIQEIEG